MNDENQRLTYDPVTGFSTVPADATSVEPTEAPVADEVASVEAPAEYAAPETAAPEEAPVDDAVVSTAMVDDAVMEEIPAEAPTADDVTEVAIEEAAVPAADMAATEAATEAVEESAGLATDVPVTAEVSTSVAALDPTVVLERLGEFLTGVFYIATMDGDQPRVRPFDSAVIDGGRIYFITDKTKPVYSQLLANPKVEIFAMPDEEGILRIAGQAVENQDEVLTRSLLERAGKYVGNANSVTFYLTNIVGEMTGTDGNKFQITL